MQKFNFWRTLVLFMGPVIPLFWTAGDICPVFQSQGKSVTFEFRHLHALDSLDSPPTLTPADLLLFRPNCLYVQLFSALQIVIPIRIYKRAQNFIFQLNKGNLTAIVQSKMTFPQMYLDPFSTIPFKEGW